MSGKVSGWVWDQPLPQNEKFVLLAYADHADHEGHNVYPSVGLIARKTGYSHRSVQRITDKLKLKGYLLPDGTGKHGTNKYEIPMPMGGDKMTPPTSGGDIAMAGGVTPEVDGGDTATSPKPSVNRQEPSVKRDSKNKHQLEHIKKEQAHWKFKKDWDAFLLAWAQYFPHKVQPRYSNGTLQDKLKRRLKNKYFRENYHSALMEASASDFINSGNWMQADWFLKNDTNWEKCLDGNYRNNGDPKQSTRDATIKVLKDWIVEEGVNEP